MNLFRRAAQRDNLRTFALKLAVTALISPLLEMTIPALAAPTNL